MKRYILSLLVLAIHTLTAQNTQNKRSEEFPEFADKTKSYFRTLKKEDYTFLVPYFEKGKWGYLHSETLKRITPAFATHLNLYKGSSYLGKVRDSLTSTEYILYLNKDSQVTFQAYPEAVSEMRPSIVYSRPFPQNIEKKSSKDGYSGFEYKEASQFFDIYAYSDLYQSADQRTPLLIPLKIAGKVYAIAGKRTEDPNIIQYGIIDSSGKPLKVFDFVHSKIIPVIGMADKENTWFIVQDLKDRKQQFSFLNNKGKYLMKNKLTQGIVNAYTSSQPHYPFYEAQNTVLGYAFSENLIFDLYEMKSINIIPKHYNALSISFTADGILKGEPFSVQREKSAVYIKVSNGSDNFYMDLSGKKYRPQD